MKKRFVTKKILYVSSCIIFVLLVYININSHIESILWKSNSSNKISDELNFKNDVRIEGKEILFRNEKYGFVIFCLHKYLIVTNGEGQLCIYSNKGKSN